MQLLLNFVPLIRPLQDIYYFVAIHVELFSQTGDCFHYNFMHTNQLIIIASIRALRAETIKPVGQVILLSNGTDFNLFLAFTL